jgi:MoxR-like ATPase
MVALFPAYMEATVFKSSEVQIIEKAVPVDETLNKNKQEIVNDSTNLKAVTEFFKNPILSDHITGILSLAKNTKINSVSIEKLANGDLQILLQGIAPTRLALLDLKFCL